MAFDNLVLEDRDFGAFREKQGGQTKRAVIVEQPFNDPVPVTTNYEKILQQIILSNWMQPAVVDKVDFTLANDRLSAVANYYEDGYIIGVAGITFTSDFVWSFQLTRYLNEDDGTSIDDDSGNPLILE